MAWFRLLDIILNFNERFWLVTLDDFETMTNKKIVKTLLIAFTFIVISNLPIVSLILNTAIGGES